jgi:hypothetical protein
MSEPAAPDQKVVTAIMLPIFLTELGQLRVASMTLKSLIESPNLTVEGKELLPALESAMKFCDSIAGVRYQMIAECGMPKEQIFPAAATFLAESLENSVKETKPENN